METADKNCPHCGYALAEGASTCPCGVSLDDLDVPAPGIVRDSLDRKLTLKKVDDGDALEIEVEDETIAAGTAAQGRGAAPQRRPSDAKGASDPGRATGPVPVPGRPGEGETVAARAKAPDKGPGPRDARDPAGQARKGMIIACPSCRARISRRAPKCPKCGKPPYRVCQICASPILASSTACRECGDPDPFLAQTA
jgi:hypothetical protein